MNLELYIARKILGFKRSKDNISGPIAKIAVFSIALSITVIICTIFIVTGFKKEVSHQITGFGGHIQISKLSSNLSYETPPISREQDFNENLSNIEGIENIQVYATKPGIIKTKDAIQAIVIKGIASDYNWSFFKTHLVEGEIFNVNDSSNTDKVIISQTLSDMLQLGLKDKFNVVFIQNPPRFRRFEISGIYKTTLEEYDKLYVLADIKKIQSLNGWDKNTVSGFEINLSDFDNLENIKRQVMFEAGYKVLEDGSVLQVSSIKDKNRHLFDWLSLFDMNVMVIIIIMLIVAGINMTSGLLILVLEKTQMIGILKSLGSNNTNVKKVFLYLSSFITIRGLLWGNIAGLTICFLQYRYHFIKLDPSAYFLNAVPVNFSFFYLFLINVGAFVAIWMVLLLPSTVISRITPAETIKYE